MIITEITSSSHGFFGVSATRYRRAEYISIAAVVVAPFKLCNIQRQIFTTNFVEAAHDATLQQRPEAIDRLSMDRAIDVLARAMPDSPVLFQFAIAGMFISPDQADLFRDGFSNEAVQRCGIGVFDDAS